MNEALTNFKGAPRAATVLLAITPAGSEELLEVPPENPSLTDGLHVNTPANDLWATRDS